MDLDFRILGPLEVTSAGAPLALGPPQQRATLACLLVHAPASVPADRIIEGLWGEAAPPTAGNLVQGYISALRRSLPGPGATPIVLREGGGYRLAIDREQLDAGRFEAALSEAATTLSHDPARAAAVLRDALHLWRGPALDGLQDRPFAALEAARLDALRVQATSDRITADLACGRGPDLVSELEDLVAQHPLDERLRGHLMVALYRAGRQADALAAFASARDTLRDELGVDPSKELREIEGMVLRQDEELTVSASRGNLPAPVSSFIGRAADLRRGEELLDAARLVTLTGAGGCGKTRLALEVARRVRRRFSGGVFLVDLAPVAEPGQVAATIARALNLVVPATTDPVDATIAFLESQPVLLVLDNCEHLLAACARVVARLLSSCPGAVVLATSREALGIAGERAWQVPSMELPAAEAQLDAIRAAESVELFVERATHAGAFELDEDNAPAIAAICRRLDGIPLALELAAALTPVLAPSEIAARLDDRFGVLTSGDPTALPRHRTLRAAIEWSYEALGDTERLVLQRLSVFAGGFPLAAVEAVCDDVPDVLGTLRGLVGKSLLNRDPVRSGSHFRMLETLRQFGRDRLAENGREQDARTRHASYVLDVVTGLAGRTRGPQAPQAMDALEDMMDEIRAALDFLRSAGDGLGVARIGAVLAWPWFLRGYVGEAEAWLDLALQSVPDDEIDLRVELLFGRSTMSTYRGDIPALEDYTRRLVELCEPVRHAIGLSYGISIRATVEWMTGRYEAAHALYTQSIDLSRQAGDAWGLVTDLAQLGRLFIDMGRLDAADRVLEEARTVGASTGDAMALGLALDQSAAGALLAGDRARAGQLAADALANYERAGFKEGIASALNMTARVARADGDARATERSCLRALEVARKLGHQGSQATAIEGLAWVACRGGDHVRAARLLGAADEIRTRIGTPAPASAAGELQDLHGDVRTALGPAFEVELREGRTLTAADLLGD